MAASPSAAPSDSVAPVTPEAAPLTRSDQLHDAFVLAFGAPPELRARAPGRVDLMGSHTDYNQGWVLTLALDRDTWAVGRVRPDSASGERRLEVVSLNTAGRFGFDLHNPTPIELPTWPNYIGGVAWALDEAGHRLPALEMAVHTIVPVNAGLSSSAALEMAASVLLEQAGGFSLDPVRRAVLGQRAENHFVGVRCGILDQYTSSRGQAGMALVLDCRALRGFSVPISPNVRVLICNTQTARALAGSQYGVRRAQCEEAVRVLGRRLHGIQALRDVGRTDFEELEPELAPEIARRARFVIEENARVWPMAEALELGDALAISELMAASYTGARELYEITTPAMDAMVHAVQKAPGAVGIRQAGAGFGGCMVAVVERGAEPDFISAVCDAYRAATGLEAHVFAVEPAAGAGPL